MASDDLPPLAATRVFEATARLLSFTRAAEELGMTQAAVSYQIKVLEDRVGAPLFLRKPKQIALTEVGEKFSPAITDAFQQMREAYADARGKSRTVLTISTIPTFASNWLALRLGLFQLEHPDVTIRIEIESRTQDLTREGIDIGIRGGFGKWPGLTAFPLMPIDFTPMLNPRLIERMGSLEKPVDLLNYPIVDPSDPWWTRWFEAMGVDPSPLANMAVTATGSQIFEANIAMAGHGVGILTRAFFQDDIQAGRLYQPFEHVGSDGQHYWLVHAENRGNVPKIRRFRDWVLAQFEAGSATAS